jgi:hypothetical protein
MSASVCRPDGRPHHRRRGRPARGLTIFEFRHVASDAPASEGALTSAPEPFLVHAVGGAVDPAGRAAVDAVLDRIAGLLGPAPRALPSFRDGQPDAGAAHPAPDVARLERLTRALDPAGTLLFQRGFQREVR